MRHGAREALGLAAYKSGDYAKARDWLQLIVDLAAITWLWLDVDGTMTDGAMYYGDVFPDPQQFDRIYVPDVLFQVSDDGGGLRKARILEKAVERGLVSEGQVLSDKEIFGLVFEPGFSTAAQVSNLSGRGVGMDVVKRNILALRGTVDLDSVEGQGTTVRLRLPLTLAIIDGFLIGAGSASYVVPLEQVLECIELPDQDKPEQGASYLNLRGEVLPFIRLRDLFEIPGEPPLRENVVVVQYAGERAGLAVDQLFGEFQTVIKPLGKVFSHIRCIGGSTILGSGEVALILDVPGLVRHVTSQETQRSARAAGQPG